MVEKPETSEIDWESYRPLVAYLVGLSVPERDKDDVIQNACMRLIETLPIYRRHCHPVQWIRKITIRAIATYHRRRNGSWFGWGKEIPNSLMERWGIEPLTEEEVINICIVHQALEHIPKKYSDVLRYIYLGKHSIGEAAELYDVTYAAMRSRKRRGLRCARRWLEGSSIGYVKDLLT